MDLKLSFSLSVIVHRVIITIGKSGTQDEVCSLGMRREMVIEPEVFLWEMRRYKERA